jgi:flagellar basal body rod protein FlgG
MLRGIYNVASAMELAARNQETVSQNIVNATTPGYRRQGLLFEATTVSPTQPRSDTQPTRQGTRTGNSAFNYVEMGPIQQTNNPLDVAMSGNAFFAVTGPKGPVYTRNGGFELGDGGKLVTRGGGYLVRGEGGGEITIPQGTSTITIGRDGTVSADGAQVGKLELASFAQPESMRRVGTTLFEGDAPQPPAAGSVRVEQGYREGSNVQPVKEMVSMVMGMRYYEAAAKAMQAMSDAVAQNTRPGSGQ